MLNKLLTLALAAISTEAAKIHAHQGRGVRAQTDAHQSTGVRGSSCAADSDCGTALRCDIVWIGEEGTCVDDDLSFLESWFAQVDQDIAGGEGTGAPQEELQELSLELPLFDNELAQILAYSESGLDIPDGSSCEGKKDWSVCGYFMSCQNGRCCDDGGFYCM